MVEIRTRSILFLLIVVVMIVVSCSPKMWDDINGILIQYGAKPSKIEYYAKDNNLLNNKKISQKTKDGLRDITANEKILHYIFETVKSTPEKKALEISALFDIWLYLYARGEEYEDIIAVHSTYILCGVSHIGLSEEIVILRSEFEELLSQVSSNVSHKDKVELLSSLWVEKYCYNRTGLKGKPEMLLTPWKNSVDHMDKPYRANFLRNYNDLSINYLGVDRNSLIETFSVSFIETGHLYGVWEDLDFWTWGELSGFKYFKYVGEQKWVEKETKGQKPPQVLQEISKNYLVTQG